MHTHSYYPEFCLWYNVAGRYDFRDRTPEELWKVFLAGVAAEKRQARERVQVVMTEAEEYNHSE